MRNTQPFFMNSPVNKNGRRSMYTDKLQGPTPSRFNYYGDKLLPEASSKYGKNKRAFFFDRMLSRKE
jgi:hypothetical protein